MLGRRGRPRLRPSPTRTPPAIEAPADVRIDGDVVRRPDLGRLLDPRVRRQGRGERRRLGARLVSRPVAGDRQGAGQVGREPLRRLPGVVPGSRAGSYLAHVRHKTIGGEPNHADTHPFARELGGRDYCFAHNGTLDGPAWELPLGAYRPVGETDSERFFCHLLHEIAARGGPLDDAGRLAMAPRDPGLGQPARQAQLPALRRPPPVRLSRRQRLEGPELPQGPRPRRPAPPLRRRRPSRSTSTARRSTTASWSRPAR